MRMLVVGLLVASAGTARADYAGSFATYEGLDRANVREVATYGLPEGFEYTALIVGKYADKTQPEIIRTGALLEHCTEKQCTAKFVSIYDDTVEVLGLVDLAGAPAAFPDQVIRPNRTGVTTIPAPAHMVHPALVVRHGGTKAATDTTYTGRSISGSESHSSVVVLSLERHRAAPAVFSMVVHEHYPSGVGQDTALRLDRGSTKGALAIVSSQQRHIDNELACIEPKPTETRWHLEKDRYVATALLGSSGCH